MKALLLALLLAVGCAKPPVHHATSMQALPPPDPGERQTLLVPEDGVTTLLVGESVALCTADDPSLMEVWGTRERISIIGRVQGRTIMHVERPGKPTEDVIVEVTPPQPNTHALGVGTQLRIPADDIKEWSESGPGIVEVRAVTDAFDGKLIIVTGKQPGTNVVVFIPLDGNPRSVEFTVAGGDRQL